MVPFSAKLNTPNCFFCYVIPEIVPYVESASGMLRQVAFARTQAEGSGTQLAEKEQASLLFDPETKHHTWPNSRITRNHAPSLPASLPPTKRYQKSFRPSSSVDLKQNKTKTISKVQLHVELAASVSNLDRWFRSFINVHQKAEDLQAKRPSSRPVTA
jgi:hypothetical protein